MTRHPSISDRLHTIGIHLDIVFVVKSLSTAEASLCHWRLGRGGKESSWGMKEYRWEKIKNKIKKIIKLN